MRAPALLGAFLLALAPLFAEAAGLGAPRDGARVFAVLLPWLALAGLPRGAVAGRRAARPELPALLLLPLGALAWAADRRAPGVAGVTVPALAGFAAVLALSAAADRGGPLHALLWTLLVPVPAALAAAFLLTGASGALGGPAGLGAWLAATPAVWAALRLAGAGASGAGADLLPLAAGALLLGVGLFEERRRRARPEAAE
jgi:hypothetical protein